jgi:hypothetical protein
MKRILHTALFMSMALLTMAQADLSVTYGYQFGARAFGRDANLRLNSSDNIGVQLEVAVAPDVMFSLTYIGANTIARLERGITLASSDINVNYYQVGATKVLPVNDKIEGLGMFTLGAVQFNPEDMRYNEEWRFSVTMGLGAKIWITDIVGIRAQVRLLAPINWAGLGFFCGTGGCGTSLQAGSTFMSGDVGAGLVFRLGGK